jgi:hypothetical protein
MKKSFDERISVWCAIFIAIISLVFTLLIGNRQLQQGRQLNEKMVQTTEVNEGVLRRLDYFEVWKIRDKLGSQQAKIYMSKWRACAESRNFIYSSLEQNYEISQSGRDLVNALENGIFPWLRTRRNMHPEEEISDVLIAINMSEWYEKLREYNIANGTSFALETVFGILVAYVDPNCSHVP